MRHAGEDDHQNAKYQYGFSEVSHSQPRTFPCQPQRKKAVQHDEEANCEDDPVYGRIATNARRSEVHLKVATVG